MVIVFDPIFYKVSKQILGIKYCEGLREVPISEFDNVKGIVVRLGIKLSKDVLSQFKNLQFVATITTGLDHVDLEYCCENNISIISLKGEVEFLNGIHATPEHTWGLLLSLIRKLPSACNSVKSGMWDRNLFHGEELYEKTLGIIGFGRVGKILSQYAHAFGMKVMIHDSEEIEESVFNVKQVSLDQILSKSNIISLNLPLDGDTENYLNDTHFSRMKQSPWFINTARGGIVDEGALLKALNSGNIKGAALDVLSNEVYFVEKKARNSLIKYMNTHDNLVITPHISGTTNESMKKTALFIENKVLNSFSKFRKEP